VPASTGSSWIVESETEIRSPPKAHVVAVDDALVRHDVPIDGLQRVGGAVLHAALVALAAADAEVQVPVNLLPARVVLAAEPPRLLLLLGEGGEHPRG